MENQETIEYIRKHMGGGYSEATIRQHFLAYGWSQAKVDGVFAQYHQFTAKPTAAKGRRHLPRPQLKKQAKQRLVRFSLAMVVLAVAAVLLVVWRSKKSDPAVVAPVQLTYQQRQTLDINTLAGAIGQYANANNALPLSLSVEPDNITLVMCGKICDPATSQITQLSVYKADNVHIESYVAGLTVPDIQTVYLVPGGRCAKGGGLGNATAAPRAMVLLYAISSGASFSQRCVTL
jgi:hypothetical protein